MGDQIEVELMNRSNIELKNGMQLSCAVDANESNNIAICKIEIAKASIAVGQKWRAKLQVVPKNAVMELRAARTFFLRSGPQIVAEVTILSL